jgi:hypothetical protein
VGLPVELDPVDGMSAALNGAELVPEDGHRQDRHLGGTRSAKARA